MLLSEGVCSFRREYAPFGGSMLLSEGCPLLPVCTLWSRLLQPETARYQIMVKGDIAAEAREVRRPNLVHLRINM